MRIVVASLFAMAAPVSFAAAQPAGGTPAQPPTIAIAAPDQTQQLELNDGSRLVGRVEAIDDGHFTFRTISGAVMTIDTATVRVLKVTTARVVDGELWEEDPNPTRLFFAPTGRALKQGEAYFGVYEVMMPFVQVGITDRISFGGGTPLYWGGGASRPIWLTPKAQLFSTDRTAAALGVLHLFVEDASVGIAYGVVTQGTTDTAGSFGLGYAYANGDSGGSPVLMLGGEHRVSRRLKFVTENYAFKGGGFLSAGLRFLGDKISADIGLVAPLFDDVNVVVPMVNFVRKF